MALERRHTSRAIDVPANPLTGPTWGLCGCGHTALLHYIVLRSNPCVITMRIWRGRLLGGHVVIGRARSFKADVSTRDTAQRSRSNHMAFSWSVEFRAISTGRQREE